MAIRFVWLYATASRSFSCLPAPSPPVPFDAHWQIVLQVSPGVQPAHPYVPQAPCTCLFFRNLKSTGLLFTQNLQTGAHFKKQGVRLKSKESGLFESGPLWFSSGSPGAEPSRRALCPLFKLLLFSPRLVRLLRQFAKLFAQ